MADTHRTIELSVGNHTYRALVGPGLVDQAGPAFAASGLTGRVRLISDTNVWPLYGQRIVDSLRLTGFDVMHTALPFGEHAKTMETVSRLYDWLLDMGVERGDLLVALGGGVCGDTVGFVAATILRGIRLVHVPTTLLAQVDSSIGGKTGINHHAGKNLIGAFHHPSLVLADTDTLSTLPPRELKAGWAEVVKMAMTLDEELFQVLERSTAALLALDPEVTAQAIARSIELKGNVVAQDERENYLRMVLNYGHTIGHAIETATNYQRYLHGEAVAIGMSGAGLLSEKMGLLPPAARRRQDGLIAAFGLPMMFTGLQPYELLGPMGHDKKARSSRLNWVLCEDVGRVCVHHDVPDDLVEEVLNLLRVPPAFASSPV